MPETVTTGGEPVEEIVALNYAEAVNRALRRCLKSAPEAILYGEDIARPGGVFGVTRGLEREFGERVFDTPISESAILGSAVGAAILGLRPIVEIMWLDFALVAFDQIVNQLANVRYVSRGEMTAPVVIRTQQGNSPGACAQHSQNLEALLLHVPGIRVCMPWTPQDAYDLIVAAFDSDDPVVVIENRTLYPCARQSVTIGRPAQSIGGVRLRRRGDDITVVTWGAMTRTVLDAADVLADRGVSVEVLETPWLNPFPTDEVLASVRRTGALAVVHEANITGGFGAEVVARAAEGGASLRIPPIRVGVPDSRIPSAPSLVRGLIPDVGDVVDALLAAQREQ